MLNKIKNYFRRFGIKDAIIASLLVHLTLITDIYIINFDKVEKEQELVEFEAILLSKNIPEPPPPSPGCSGSSSPAGTASSVER